MENSFSKYYIYLHKTLEGIPFYVGIGTKQYGDCENVKLKYSRAYSNKRNVFWKRIVSKYKYEVEILLECNDYDFIKNQEIYFIKFYGRRDLKEGTLCNLTDGGEGVLNKIYTEDQIQRMSQAQKQRFLNMSEEDKNKMNELYKSNSIRMRGNQYAKGNVLTQTQKDFLLKNRLEKLSKRVIQESLSGDFIKEFYTTVEAAESIGVSRKALWKACSKYEEGATSKGYRWRFKE